MTELVRGVRAHRVGGGALALAVVLVAFFAVYGGILGGRLALLGGNSLYGVAPWLSAAGKPPIANPLVSDVLTEFLPWQRLVDDAYHHGRLPLWNPYAFGGTPLLGNDQSAPFSPFTLFASLFDPVRGLSLAMLVKLWIAGLGVAMFLRVLGGRGAAQVLGGFVYATGSFMTVWLGHPQSAVAALIPFGFAAVESYVARGSRRALAGLAAVTALQFFGGHAEASVHFMLALGAYGAVRTLGQGWRGVPALFALACSGAVGVALASVQVLPFLAALGDSPLVSMRAHGGVGSGRWPLTFATSWLVPNAYGHPVLDSRLGRGGNYAETTFFCGVTALVLAGLAVRPWWGRNRLATMALVGMVLVTMATIYTPFVNLVGRLPLLDVTPNQRSSVVTIFAVATLAGLGFDHLLGGLCGGWGPSRWSLVGLLCAAGVAAAGVVEWKFTRHIDTLLPPLGHLVGFWVAVAVMTLGAAAFLSVDAHRGGRVAAVGLFAVVILEGVMFAAPYTPHVPVADVPPRSELMSWLQAHVGGDRVASAGINLAPESGIMWNLSDVRGYDLTYSHLVGDYWRLGDRGYEEQSAMTALAKPDARFLAAAGVRYFVTQGDELLATTRPVFTAEAMTVSEVPEHRPFAFTVPSGGFASTVRVVDNTASAQAAVRDDPIGQLVVETHGRGFDGLTTPPFGAPVTSRVAVREREPEHLVLAVDAAKPSALVLLQTNSPGWTATVDGLNAELASANVLFQAVPVPAGRHRVELRYTAPLLSSGALLSGLGLVGLPALWLLQVPAPRRRRRGGHSTPGAPIP